jgi:hypothetical protein
MEFLLQQLQGNQILSLLSNDNDKTQQIDLIAISS